jgi:hypothetical protein
MNFLSLGHKFKLKFKISLIVEFLINQVLLSYVCVMQDGVLNC